MQFSNGVLGFFYCCGDEFLGVRQIICVFERFLLQPFEAVQLEVSRLYLGDGEGAPAVLFGGLGVALDAAVWIGPVAFLELGEVGRGEGAVRPAQRHAAATGRHVGEQ